MDIRDLDIGSGTSGLSNAWTGRYPDFFLVGAPKCATSSLHLALRAHPQVFMCSPKEPHFFSTDMPGLAEVADRDSYTALFDPAPEDARRGEASAFYLSSETAADNIRTVVPDARIVLSIRDPVDAAQSLYHQLRDGFREDQTSFADAWRLQEARARGENLPAYCPEPKQLQYRQIFSYHDQIRRYFNTFGRDRVMVLRFERIRSEPESVMHDLLEFLGLPAISTPHAIPKSNTRREPMLPGLTQFIAAPPRLVRPLVGPAKRALNHVGLKPSDIVMKHLSRPMARRSQASLSPALRAEIGEAFAPDVTRLETLLDTDLSAWKH